MLEEVTPTKGTLVMLGFLGVAVVLGAAAVSAKGDEDSFSTLLGPDIVSLC